MKTNHREKMVPTEAIRELTAGSFEHMSLRLDDAIAESVGYFTNGTGAEAARIATFPGHVVVGTSDGRYMRATYEDRNGQIYFGNPEALSIQTIDTTNVKEYVNNFTMKAVDALMFGSTNAKDQILALMSLDESINIGFDDDLSSLVRGILASDSVWKDVYHHQAESIKGQLSDVIDSLIGNAVESKYMPLYDGSIPEEKFHTYRGVVTGDLTNVSDRLTRAQEGVDGAYLPFAERVAQAEGMDAEEREVSGDFVAFAESLSQELNQLRDHVKIALEHEQCVMCLGQIHDAIAEALTDYEIASSFVERMATRFAETA